MKAKVHLPPKLVPVFQGPARYRGAYGGRGSGKSKGFATMASVFGYVRKRRILSVREFQNSISESSKAEIEQAIEDYPWMKRHYDIGESYIRGKNGTEFLFKGLRRSIMEIKSMSNIDIVWVEEAETVTDRSWRILIPTVRATGSEIWITWNRERTDSATSQRFIINPPKNSKIIRLNWSDNPWFPAELEAERQSDMARDPLYYDHVWEGEPLSRTDAQVFADHYTIEAFEPGEDWKGPYHGMDFGFANDPTVAVEVYIHADKLYVRRGVGKAKLELDDTSRYFRQRIPDIERHVMRADCARPESISYLKRNGLPRIMGVSKWPGSVEDGIAHLKSYDQIIIHPECDEVHKEFRLYSYKVDKNTDDVLPQIVDEFNHYIDAIRYAVEPLVKRKGELRVRAL